MILLAKQYSRISSVSCVSKLSQISMRGLPLALILVWVSKQHFSYSKLIPGVSIPRLGVGIVLSRCRKCRPVASVGTSRPDDYSIQAIDSVGHGSLIRIPDMRQVVVASASTVRHKVNCLSHWAMLTDLRASAFQLSAKDAASAQLLGHDGYGGFSVDAPRRSHAGPDLEKQVPGGQAQEDRERVAALLYEELSNEQCDSSGRKQLYIHHRQKCGIVSQCFNLPGRSSIPSDVFERISQGYTRTFADTSRTHFCLYKVVDLTSSVSSAKDSEATEELKQCLRERKRQYQERRNRQSESSYDDRLTIGARERRGDATRPIVVQRSCERMDPSELLLTSCRASGTKA
nr:hypothetical protein CFP56_02522 [Quercus suber]